MTKKVLTVTEFASMGGKARAARYTPAELRAFAENAGRRPWKITPEVKRRILAMLGQGRTQAEVARRFGMSLRTVGRLKARNREGD